MVQVYHGGDYLSKGMRNSRKQSSFQNRVEGNSPFTGGRKQKTSPQFGSPLDYWNFH
jgi:hypothetical protein